MVQRRRLNNENEFAAVERDVDSLQNGMAEGYVGGRLNVGVLGGKEGRLCGKSRV